MRQRLAVGAFAYSIFLVIGLGGRADSVEGGMSSTCLPQDLVSTSFLPAPPDGNVPIYVMKPYNLHLSVAGTNTGQLRIYDEDGLEVTSGLFFTGYHDWISVSPTGLVTALQAEPPDEIGTSITAYVSGQWVQNDTVVRVLSADYDIDFVERVGTESVIYSPLEIHGENIDQYVDQYEMLTVVDYAYQIQQDLIKTLPYAGAKQIYELDFGESDTGSVCGIAGNPIRLGWNLNGGEWGNCFLVPIIPPRSPQWFVITHELGHSISFASGTFLTSVWHTRVEMEGIASYLALIAMRRICEDTVRYPVGQPAIDSLEMDRNGYASAFMASYVNWMDDGAPFGDLDPNIVDGILLNLEGAEPDAFAERFFNIFAPMNQDSLQPILDRLNSLDSRHTFFAAACSAAAQQDLYDLFLNTYHFPLDTALFNDALATMNALPPFLFSNGFESGDTSAWSSIVP